MYQKNKQMFENDTYTSKDIKIENKNFEFYKNLFDL